jgi:hypothetical protein
MGAPLTEFVIETVIRDGLGFLRANPAVLDDIFSKFTATWFVNQYGTNHIEKLKTFIQENQVKIVHSFAQVPTSTPCISIQILKSSEAPKLQQFSNEYEDVDSPIDPIVRIANVQPISYDVLTGKLIVDPGTDLGPVFPGMVFIDADAVEFTIQSGNSNLAGNKFISLVKNGNVPNLSNPGQIVSSIRVQRIERRMIRLEETISLGVHAKNDVHVAKYLYYLLTYIMKSRMDSLIQRGIHLDFGVGGVFDRVDEHEGKNVFSRFIEVNCITEFDWNQEQVNLVDNFDLTIRAPDGITPTSTTVVKPKDD